MSWDIQFAIPSKAGADLYRQHQEAWEAAASIMRSRTEFLFTWEPRPLGAIVQIRAPHRCAGARKTTLPRQGRMKIRLAAGRQSAGATLVPVNDVEACNFFAERMTAAGISVADISVSPIEWLSGSKAEHLIKVPTRLFSANYSVVDHERAWHAVTRGVGRAKRFGCGMLISEL